jgi:diaminopimelate epimerase
MAFEFYKYQGTGNDFILIDNRTLHFPKNDTPLVAHLCDRKFGIGADGLILLEPHSQLDFTMVYYNSDGNFSSMCGNGGRCLVHFARFLGIIENSAQFEATDGIHHALMENEIISLSMNSVHTCSVNNDYIFLNTGSPHHVQMVDEVQTYDVFKEGRKIRNELYGAEGANVNFVTPIREDTFEVRTYERGVEDETLSCGTGVTAVALAMYEIGKTHSKEVKLETPGGSLRVCFEKNSSGYEHVRLIGPAVQVFKGFWP